MKKKNFHRKISPKRPTRGAGGGSEGWLANDHTFSGFFFATFPNLTDVTLADQATNSMQADNANMAIQGNVAMKVTQSSGQRWNQCKRRHPFTNF